jgi:hypothetical protein
MYPVVYVHEISRVVETELALVYSLEQWFSTCGTRTPRGTWWTGWGYAKIILVMAENTQKKRS